MVQQARVEASGEVIRGASRDRFHDLRHYYASLLIRHGESGKVDQARLGSATSAESMDTYRHLWQDAEDSSGEAVELVLGRSADSLRPRR